MIEWATERAWRLNSVYCVFDGKTLVYMIHRDPIIQLYFPTMYRQPGDYDMKKILEVKINKLKINNQDISY